MTLGPVKLAETTASDASTMSRSRFPFNGKTSVALRIKYAVTAVCVLALRSVAVISGQGKPINFTQAVSESLSCLFSYGLGIPDQRYSSAEGGLAYQ
jgi:hypothetical protein